mmetsp:Transcript_20967/g.50040  ORF Transcript_20967/g.50040 Transcript_20967/m.50040 type:complete len:253 (+) Transcript_20967:1231-1989(+)
MEPPTNTISATAKSSGSSPTASTSRTSVPARGSGSVRARELHRQTERPIARSSSCTCPHRHGCLGAMIVSSAGKPPSSWRCVCPMTGSSPLWVEAATQQSRAPTALLSSSTRSSLGRHICHTQAPIAAAYLRSAHQPGICHSSAPRSRKLATSRSLCGMMSEKQDSMLRARSLPVVQLCQRRKLLFDIRALRSARATPRSRARQIRFGHSSDSTKTAASGLQWSRKRSTTQGTSSGANCSTVLSGSAFWRSE